MATEKAKRFLSGNPSLDQRRTDVRLALAVLIVQVGAMLLIALHGDHPHRKDLDAIGVMFLVGGPLLLIWRRQAPRAVLSATLVLTGSYYLLGYPYGPAFISLVVAYFTAITRGHHVFAYGSAVCGLIAFIALDRLAGWGADLTVSDYFGVSAWLIVVLIGSEAVCWRRERVQEQRRAQSEEQRRKVSEDRARMAQELHDVLGHNISLINVRAGVALHLIDDKPEEARAALEAIKAASKDALSELRAVLGLLHQEGEAAPRAPAPGIAQLDQLVSDARASGLLVEISSAGDARTLAPAVDLAAFRIVQEALTNVMRHAKDARARIDLRYADDEVLICVDDAGRAVRPNPGHGRGIDGMRERAVALGGSLTAGPKVDGGFRVLAHLPYGRPV